MSDISIDVQIAELQAEIEKLDSRNQHLLNKLESGDEHTDGDQSPNTKSTLSSLMRKLYGEISDGDDRQYTNDEMALLNKVFSANAYLRNESSKDFFQIMNVQESGDMQFLFSSLKNTGIKAIDPSIARFFDSQKRNKSRRVSRTKKQSEIQKRQILAKLKEQQLVNDIIDENLKRMVGITAFPVSDPASINEENEVINLEEDGDAESDNEEAHQSRNILLGIRFDTYNEHIGNFERPHYVILRRNLKNNQYFVFKHTIPNYIDLQHLETKYLNRDMSRFAKSIYSQLQFRLSR